MQAAGETARGWTEKGECMQGERGREEREGSNIGRKGFGNKGVLCPVSHQLYLPQTAIMHFPPCLTTPYTILTCYVCPQVAMQHYPCASQCKHPAQRSRTVQNVMLFAPATYRHAAPTHPATTPVLHNTLTASVPIPSCICGNMCKMPTRFALSAATNSTGHHYSSAVLHCMCLLAHLLQACPIPCLPVILADPFRPWQ